MQQNRGFTITEVLVAMAIAAAILLFAAKMIVDGREASRVQQAADDVSKLVEGAYKWGAMRGNYTGLTCALAQQYQQSVTSCSATNPWGGNYVVSPGTSCTGGTTRQICVTMTGLQADVSNQLVAKFNGVVASSYVAANQPYLLFNGA